MAENRVYFAFIKLFRSRLMSKDTKVKLYKALIRPVVTYGAQARTLRTVDEQTLRVLERKVLRRIYGEWRLSTKAELDNLLGPADLNLLGLRGSAGLDMSSEWKKTGGFKKILKEALER
jgi:hypothetical protein